MRRILSGRRGAAVAAVGMLGLGLGVGLGLTGTAASADSTVAPAPATSTAAPSTAATSSERPTRGEHPRLAELRELRRNALHGEATVRTDKGFQVVDGQRGKVTAISPTSLSVTSDDGFAATYVLNGDTKYRVDQKAAKVTDIHSGDTVVVRARSANDTRTAVAVTEPKR
ncbi:DUF5666 domain-containing protein [Frankia sp. AiPs1]|uniref:hypothetical protein n=1 Tax=Frankia sp. AiPa1 TaxID=573492 RepID=UPI00202B1BC2|nr:hypothetical protein [Frankia sp. AiPa1]MCL9759171.1 hypothetical protein [Frankia sp. AiPa1]